MYHVDGVKLELRSGEPASDNLLLHVRTQVRRVFLKNRLAFRVGAIEECVTHTSRYELYIHADIYLLYNALRRDPKQSWILGPYLPYEYGLEAERLF